MKTPEIKEIKKINYPQYEKIFLDNGIPVIFINSQDTEAFRLDIVFQAGRYFESFPVAAKVTANLLKEGTSKMASKEIAEYIDYRGANISTNSGMDTAYIQANFLNRYFKEIVNILFQIISEPAFPENELEKFKVRQIERLKNDLSKNDVLAFRHFTEHIFGKNHPYGYSSTVENYQQINRKHLYEHYSNFYSADKCKIYLTGNIDNSHIQFLNNSFGKISNIKGKHDEVKILLGEPEFGKFRYSNDRIHQTALRIGKKMITRDNPDYPGLYFLNTVLGGYFGARLSENIREDKGYTYGIYSTLDSLYHEGYFIIGSDVGNIYLDDTLKEIYKEIEILKNDLIENDEMMLVRNYLKGNLLSMTNGNLLSLNLVKTLEYNNLGKSYFDKFVNIIDSISASELRDLAIKYFNIDSLTEVLVGHF